jgi:Sulfotransferase family
MPVLERTLSPDLRDARRREGPRWLVAARSAARGWGRRLLRRRDRGGVLVPPTPPVCPPGWQTGPPDFVGVGGQRCGTTRWFDLLASHPEVVPPVAAKELHYFDRFYAGGFTPADAAGYHDYFPSDGEHKLGEWTPIYMAAPWIPRLLAAAAPDARLLVLLRDPVERYLSGLQHDTRLARENGLPLSQLAPLEAFVRGFYHAQLTRLLAHFDRSQILVLQYERCTREPLGELRRTFEFLGLRDTEFVPDLEAHPNRQPSKPTLDPDTRAAYVRGYREDVLNLVSDFPEIDVRLWPNFADLAD